MRVGQGKEYGNDWWCREKGVVIIPVEPEEPSKRQNFAESLSCCFRDHPGDHLQRSTLILFIHCSTNCIHHNIILDNLALKASTSSTPAQKSIITTVNGPLHAINMHSLLAVLFTSLLAAFAAAQNSTLDPNSVPLSQRSERTYKVTG